MSQLGSVVKSVNEAAEKFNKSNNKKNTASLESRLKNTIKIAQKMLDSIQ
jgi:CCR4-NOT transcriptional regulation complex NOT5 subunit